MRKQTKPWAVIIEVSCGHFWHRGIRRAFVVESSGYPQIDVSAISKSNGRRQRTRIVAMAPLTDAQQVADVNAYEALG